jgi:hypothetical protein
MTVTRKPDHRGEREYKPLKPLRAGMPGDSGATVVTTLACSLHILHARLRVHWAPGIPHALSWAEDSCTARTLRAAGSRTRIRLLLPATWRYVARLSHGPVTCCCTGASLILVGPSVAARAFSSESLPRTRCGMDAGSHGNQVYADCVDLSAAEKPSNQEIEPPFRFKSERRRL